MIEIINVKGNKNIDKFNRAAKKAHDHPETHGLLVKIYADWCGHCRNMKADWKRLIHELKTNYHCKKPGCVLTIANIRAVNLEQNDPVLQNLKHIPKDIQSIPTIMYISKGARGLEYSDERVYSEMLKWIINHPSFTLVRKSRSHGSTMHNITRNARHKFKKFHNETLKHFHKDMKKHHTSTPRKTGYVPAYLRE
jgi:thiol-disulfide isomerase/thioredoxin